MIHDCRRKGLIVSATMLVFLTTSVATAAVVAVYEEDFTGQNGKGAVGLDPAAVPPGPTIDLSGVSWTIDISGTDLNTGKGFLQVVNEQFVANDPDGPGRWMSPQIDISAFTNVGFSLDAQQGDSVLESSDYFDVSFVIDGGPSTLIADFNGKGDATHTFVDDFDFETVSVSGLSGGTLELFVDMNNSALSENMILDNIVVTGTPISLSQIPEPSARLVWSVVMIAGGCFTIRWLCACNPDVDAAAAASELLVISRRTGSCLRSASVCARRRLCGRAAPCRPWSPRDRERWFAERIATGRLEVPSHRCWRQQDAYSFLPRRSGSSDD